MSKNTKKHYPRYNFEDSSKWSVKMVDNFKLTKSTAQRTDLKPDGLWYSLYSAWVSWGEVSQGKHIHKITFIPKVHISWQKSKQSNLLKHSESNHKNKIVVLRTFEDIQQFAQQYGVKVNQKYAMIRWKDVAKDFGGVEFRHFISIAKHIHKNDLTYTYLWYLSLDVSSGCVWNHTLVKHIDYVFDKV